jgi:hypothetical protein
MIVVNGEPFIRYNLENIYPHAHEILIVEGAVEKFRHAATPAGHSIDNTVEIIKNFPDPANKIKLIQRYGFWSEKDEMSNAYMEACTGDYIWQVDVDEFYKKEDIEKIRTLLSQDPEISRVDVRSVVFWRSFKARIMGASYIYGADEFIRIFKFKPGYRYLTHRPPTLIDENGQQFDHKKILSASELERQGIVQYHYSFVFPEKVKGKAEYYSRMGWGQGHEDGLVWFEENMCNIANPLRLHMIKYPPSWLVLYECDHPEIINVMCKHIDYKESPEIIEYLVKESKRYQVIGANIAKLLSALRVHEMSRISAFIGCIKNIVLPSSKKQFNADITIIYTAFQMLINRPGC